MHKSTDHVSHSGETYWPLEKTKSLPKNFKEYRGHLHERVGNLLRIIWSFTTLYGVFRDLYWKCSFFKKKGEALWSEPCPSHHSVTLLFDLSTSEILTLGMIRMRWNAPCTTVSPKTNNCRNIKVRSQSQTSNHLTNPKSDKQHFVVNPGWGKQPLFQTMGQANSVCLKSKTRSVRPSIHVFCRRPSKQSPPSIAEPGK